MSTDRNTLNKLLVVSSTYPSCDDDTVPSFVEDQLKAFTKLRPDLEVFVLAPHNQSSRQKRYPRRNGRITQYRFHYFIPSMEVLTDKGIMPGLKVNKLNYALLPFFIFGELISLLIVSRKIRPNLIYAHWFTPQAITSSIVSRLTGIPYVFTTHASDVAVWNRFGYLGKLIVRVFCKNSKAITAVSTQTAEKLLSFFHDDEVIAMKKKLKIIPMGIYVSQSERYRKNANNILFIGRLTEKKGLQFALPAFSEIVSMYPEATLSIAGDGEMRRELEAKAKKLKLNEDRLHFLGFVKGKKKEYLLSEAEILIVPSIDTDSGDSEGLPVSLMEGLSAGCICVATSASGASDLITDGVNGFLIDQRNSKAIVSALDAIIRMRPNDREKIRDNAVEIARDLDWSRIAKRHLDLFDGCSDAKV